MDPPDIAACLPSGEPYRLVMGLRPLALERWLDRDGRRAEMMRRKAVLLTDRPDDVVAHRPEAGPASAEVLELVLAHMEAHWPDSYHLDGQVVTDLETGLRTDLGALHPIDGAGRLVSEDLCVMVEASMGWVLGAASVCFPSRWSLASKMGASLSAIHDPVPDYPGRLAGAVDNFFDRLRVERPMWRTNWTILDDPELFQPSAAARAVGAARTDLDVGAALHVRVERQTLRRLPATGAVLFTIATSVSPLVEVVAASPELARNLAATLQTVPAANVDYKGWRDLLEPTLAWLASVSRAGCTVDFPS